MPTPQMAIFQQGLRAHEHLEFDLRPGATAATVRAALVQLEQPGVVQAAVAGFGAQLWRLLAPGDEVPPDLAPLPVIHGTGGTMPSQPHDFWLWLQDRGPDLNLDAARHAVDALAPVMTLAEDTPGFVYRDGRDLTGFIDGTENPSQADAPAVAIRAEGPGAGGSFVLVQRWRHDLTHFHQLPLADQEATIGRTKADSVELAELPKTSHVARMVVKTADGELKIWRRSVPWGKAAVNGLQFVGFSADPQRLIVMLERMYGATADRVYDRMLDFSKPETGALYFVPSLEALNRWVKA